MKHIQYYIYYWFNKDKNNEVVYIGKGKENRYLVSHRNIYFNRTYEKYNLYPVIMINNLNEQEAFELEREHISFWKNRKQAKTNLHEGGYGGNVFKYYPEGKKKMIGKNRLSNSGRNNAMFMKDWRIFSTPDKIKLHKINCSIGQKKRFNDPMARKKISEANIKRWQNEENRKNYNLNNSRRWHQFDLNGNYLKTFSNLGEVLQHINMIGHGTLFKNERLKKPYKGYYWIKEEEKGVETIEKESNYFHLVE